jgi:hypothetical protein
MFGDSDLAAIFNPNELGVPVTFGGSQVTGAVDEYTDVFNHGGGPGGFETGLIILHLAWNAFNPMPKLKDTITLPAHPNLPAGVPPGDYIVKALPKNRDSSIVEHHLKRA